MILFVSGATGGHIYPGVALAQTLNLPAHFVVSREYPAKSILAPYKLPFQVIGFSVKRVLLFPILASQILRVLLKKRPQMIIAMGGGICVPFAVMGWCFRIPVISFEQNAIPGRATRAIQFFCKKIITAFESAKNGLYAKSKVMCMGNPTRLHYPITDALPDEWDQIKGTTLLVVGGSQGALKINEFIYENRQAILMRGMNIIHLTGPAFLKGKASFVDSDNEHVYVAIPYLNNMNLAYQKASVVMCRSGATTLAELHYQHIPSILVPYHMQWITTKKKMPLNSQRITTMPVFY